MPAGLPCLSSNNSIESESQTVELTTAHKRTAHCLQTAIQGLAKKYGVERLGFLTLTFPDSVRDMREASRRFNSLATNVLKKRYCRGIRVWERHRSGCLHAHLVVVLPVDIRSGVDFQAFAEGDYRSASQFLRDEWKFWRSITNYDGKHPDHAYAIFGRTELLPVKSTAEGIAYYVGGYIAKHVGQRDGPDKGKRFVSYLGFEAGERQFKPGFAWRTPGSQEWRLKLRYFARVVGATCMEDLTKKFGPRWAYSFKDQIIASEPELEDHLEQRFANGKALVDSGQIYRQKWEPKKLAYLRAGDAPPSADEWEARRYTPPLPCPAPKGPRIAKPSPPDVLEVSRAFCARLQVAFPEEPSEKWARLRETVRALPQSGEPKRVAPVPRPGEMWWEW